MNFKQHYDAQYTIQYADYSQTQLPTLNFQNVPDMITKARQKKKIRIYRENLEEDQRIFFGLARTVRMRKQEK